MSILKHCFFTFLLAILFSNSALAQAIETGWLRSFNHLPVKVNFQLTGQPAEQNKVNALLNVSLEGDWKTYWRSPGEGGVAPTFDWQSDSHNIKAVDWSWPSPKRYPVLGVETVGYKGNIHFPIQLTLTDVEQLAQLKGTLTLASCTTICVLTDYDIDLRFDPTLLMIDQNVAFDYAQAVSNVPIVITEDAIKAQQNNANMTAIKSYWDQSAQQVVVQLSHLFPWQNPDVFLDTPTAEQGELFFSKPNITVADKQITATFDVTRWGGEVNLNNANIHVTVVDQDVAVEVSTTLSDDVITQHGESLFFIFLIALLGGAILNVMPCVLPVLGMKLSTVLDVDDEHRSTIRKQFLASSVGIISSFWLLALFLVVLKLSGQALGWGIQFQNPYFIAFMVMVTAVFTANMLGLFEIQLPASLQTWLATKGGHSYVGHYLQGMFATLLATPCTAPFLGTAVAFALGASIWQLFAIFTALGLGMALPWLLIALFPAIALLLPKPGKWMGSIKLVFGVLILMTCLWLISLLTLFIGEWLTVVLALVLLLIFAILIFRKYGKRLFLIVFSSVLLFCAMGFIVASLTTQYWTTSFKDEMTWVPLDVAKIQHEVEQGRVVFVDITANWCVTCKANKIGVLLQEPVYSALQEPGIIAMKGDWTVRSDSVTAYLQSFGRYGVPFNIVYGPAAPGGIELSTLLDSDDVIQALQQAKGQ